MSGKGDNRDGGLGPSEARQTLVALHMFWMADPPLNAIGLASVTELFISEFACVYYACRRDLLGRCGHCG